MGCTANTGPADTAPDPFEQHNRRVHEFNKQLDRNVLKPASESYVEGVPRPVRRGVSNVMANLDLPLNAANHLLQGDLESSLTSVARFGMNSFFGLGGLLDPASEAGIFVRETDFGETLATWGVPSGPYVEVPVLGPSTMRDSLGRFVDLSANPVNFHVKNDMRPYLVAGRVGELLQTRSDMARVLEMLLYESADSYSAARIAYLQNRARNVGNGMTELQVEDIYAFD